MMVVSNTSPITNLAAVGQLDLLRQLYEKVLIPQAVYGELTGGDGDSLGRSRCRRWSGSRLGPSRTAC